jgi:quercetin dioxygenase-like cupin family protein
VSASRAALVGSVALALAIVADAQELRLTPPDVAAKASADRVAGTSGVAGIVTTVLAGDPSASGPYTIALRVPAHAVIAAHTHRDARSAVVISGTWWFGYGTANTPERLKALPPGSFYTEPAGQPHFARTGDTPVVVYITGVGPTDTHYVDAAAAPRAP